MKKSHAILAAANNGHHMGNFTRGQFKGFYISRCKFCGAKVYRDSDNGYTGDATYTNCLNNQKLNQYASNYLGMKFKVKK